MGFPFSGGDLLGFAKQGLEDLVGRKPEVPELRGIDPSQIQAATIAANKQQLPQLEAIGQQINQFNLQQQLGMLGQALNFLAPGQLQQAQGVISSQLRGEVPKDVQLQLQRRAAAQALAGGFGGGSGIGRNLTLRDFGLSSLGIQQQGLSNFGNLASLAPRTPLFDMSPMFFTPQQRLNTAFAERDNEFNRNWLSEQIAAAPSPLGQFIQNVVYAVAGTAGRWIGTAGGGGTSAPGPAGPA